VLILASSSPRRQELLRLITADFAVRTKDTSEEFRPGTPPEEVVQSLALRKAAAVAADCPGDAVIGADTVVALDGCILGKPENAEDAVKMLRTLSGREPVVYTGVAVLHPGGRRVFAERTAVEFIPMSERQILDYVGTGEPMDKAGAYGIQGPGALFVRGIKGDYYNVMGLPVCSLAQILYKLKIFPEQENIVENFDKNGYNGKDVLF
jgi:septum formation protein